MKIVCAGGGTLGSVTPLLAVVEILRKHASDIDVLWIGTHHGPERTLVQKSNIAFVAVPSGKLRRYFSLQNLIDVFFIVIGFFKAFKLLLLTKPNVVLTAGSYVAVPVALAAWILRIPVCLHQQDARPGLTNIILKKIARLITVTFVESVKDFPNSLVTGNPVRSEFFRQPADRPSSVAQARTELGLQPKRPVILIIGGGTGAEFLNQLIISCLDELLLQAQVLHITGIGKISAVSAAGYYPLSFTTNTLLLLVAADVVVTRAGMGTLTELGALQKASIVIPIPQSHQEDNVQVLKKHNAAIILDQLHLTNRQFVDMVRQLLINNDKRQELGANLGKLFVKNAAEKVVEEVLKILNLKSQN